MRLALVATLLFSALGLAEEVKLAPFFNVAGGLKGEQVQARPGQYRENRVATLMVSRFGLVADLSDWIRAESEFEANAGLHGASAWEGQAALQVRNQLVRLYRPTWKVEAGRVTDEASIDFLSAHVGDMLFTDGFTREPLLFSGYNRGNGALGVYEVLPGLKLGLTFNAANPVSTTGSLVAGGPFPPFERYYLHPFQSVNQVANHMPDDSFHLTMATPSVSYRNERVEAKAAVQLYMVDLDVTSKEDEGITGRNVRGGVRVELLPNRLAAFANVAWNQNDMLDPQNVRRRSGEYYHSLSAGGGVDFAIRERDGIGAQYTRVQFRPGQLTPVVLHWVNVGGTLWLGEKAALGVRAAWMLRREQAADGPVDEGERALFATLRTSL